MVDAIFYLVNKTLAFQTPLFCLTIGLFLTTSAISGERLAYLQVPDRPLMTPVMRIIGVMVGFVSKIVIIVILTIIMLVAGYTYYLGLFWDLFTVVENPSSFFFYGVAGGAILAVIINFRWIPLWERGDGVADIQTLEKVAKKLVQPYKAEHYINPRKGIFIGLNQKRKPVYASVDMVRKNHIQEIGVTGTGKSSLGGLLLSQCAISGETVIIVDPKDDEHLPCVLSKVAKDREIPFYLIDLRPTAPPQINPLEGCTEWEVAELFNSAFELAKSGDPAVDFYRGEDRDATDILASLYLEGATDLPKLFTKAAAKEEITDRQNLWREFRRLVSLPVFQTEEGLDLKQAIESGSIIYIVGSTINDKVFAAQRLLLQRILQIVASRPRQNSRPVALMLDELKYILSNPALRAMGTIRDRNCHLIVAHQSLQDLYDCPGLDPQSVIGAVHGNTSLKFIFRILEMQSAIEFEGLSGLEKTFTEMSGRAGENQGSSWREAERPRFRRDIFTHLPKPVKGEASVSVAIGLGTPFLLSSRYLQSGPRPEVVPAKPLVNKSATAATVIEELI